MSTNSLRKTETASFDLQPLTPAIGAEITGIDLREPVDVATLRDLRTALLDWKVLFFRDQDITTEQHLAFARNFGELEVTPSRRTSRVIPKSSRSHTTAKAAAARTHGIPTSPGASNRR